MSEEMLKKELRHRISKLRDEWASQAWGIERSHGEEDPAAKTFRACIGDLAKVEYYIINGQDAF